MAPVKSSVSSVFISAGARQLLVGPASALSAEQMNVRSSTRATSAGSERARKLFGRSSPFRRSNVPPSTSSWVSVCHSSSEPSHHSTRSGSRIAAQWSTQSLSFWLVVVEAMVLRRRVGFSVGVGDGAQLGIEARRAHVDLRAQPQPRGPTLAVEVEDHALTWAQQPEDG